MAFPKFKPDFRSAMLGVGALAIAASPFVSTPAYSQDAREVPGFSAPAAVTTTAAASATAINYQDWGLPTPQAPTASRPYYYVKFDQSTRDHYVAGPQEMGAANRDRLVVMNFIDEQNAGYSARQTELLQRALTALAPRSQAKELMLVDVIVRDGHGNMPYGSAYTSMYDHNTLGPDGQPKDDYTLPYGIVRGEEITAGDGNTLYDFSLYADAKTEADIRANSQVIAGVLLNIVTTYNQKKVASLDSDTGAPTLVAVNN